MDPWNRYCCPELHLVWTNRHHMHHIYTHLGFAICTESVSYICVCVIDMHHKYVGLFAGRLDTIGGMHHIYVGQFCTTPSESFYMSRLCNKILRRTIPSPHCADGVYYLNCSMETTNHKVFVLGAD